MKKNNEPLFGSFEDFMDSTRKSSSHIKMTDEELSDVAAMTKEFPDLKEVLEDIPEINEQFANFGDDLPETPLPPGIKFISPSTTTKMGYATNTITNAISAKQMIPKPLNLDSHYNGGGGSDPSGCGDESSEDNSGVSLEPYYYQSKRKGSRREEIAIDRVFTPRLLDSDDVCEAVTPSDVEDFDGVKNALKVLRSDERTLVFAVAVDKKEDENNAMTAIKCNGGTAFGGYARDLARDSYIVQCVECAQLGQIPFSYFLTMDNVGQWRIKVPLSEDVIEKHLTPANSLILTEFRKKWPKKKYDIHFIQMLGCN